MDPAKVTAWKTRRERYGQSGHSGSYRCGLTRDRKADGALRLIVRLHQEGVLSEGQVSSALGISRIEVRKLSDEGRLKGKDHE